MKPPDWLRVANFVFQNPGCRFLTIASALGIAEVRGRIVDARRKGWVIECVKGGSKEFRYYVRKIGKVDGVKPPEGPSPPPTKGTQLRAIVLDNLPLFGLDSRAATG